VTAHLTKPQRALLDEIREKGTLYIIRSSRYGRTVEALERRGLVRISERDLSGRGQDGWTATEPTGGANMVSERRVHLSCTWCGHWEVGARTKEQIAEWLRVHRAAQLTSDHVGIDRESTCPQPCGTPGGDHHA
jgi:hypothetical protein